MDSYLILKAVHILGVIIFLGNIIVTGWWKFMADKHGDPVVVAFAQRQVTLTDFAFTGGGVAVLFIAGISNVMMHHMDIFAVRWLLWGFGILTLSGAIWVGVLIPIQYQQARMARDFENGGEIPAEYWRLNRLWYIWGIIDTLIPLSAIYWMVMKPM